MRKRLFRLLAVWAIGSLATAVQSHARPVDIELADAALWSLVIRPGMADQTQVVRKRSQIISQQLLGGLPRSAAVSDDEMLLVQQDYVIWYDRGLRVPLWVGYRLTPANLVGSSERPEAFRPDPRLPPQARADLSDYEGSGFDRGHMAPDADFRHSTIARVNTYILSNICPQYPPFNRGLWAQFERRVREWAREFGAVYVVTGAIFDRDGDGQRDPDSAVERIPPLQRVGLPTAFYKIIVRKKGATWDALAVVLSHRAARAANQSTAALLTRGITTIDAVEKIAAVNFFPGLPDAEEARLEKSRATSLW
ncbi:MAG: DNA/RNA non-specific endonuclease [Armatimonadetes bacterium]|nr:DNA/RNA non-specific endonuclease [Armatimonadota bacterium]